MCVCVCVITGRNIFPSNTDILSPETRHAVLNVIVVVVKVGTVVYITVYYNHLLKALLPFCSKFNTLFKTIYLIRLHNLV